AVLVAELFRQILDVVGVHQHALDDFHHCLARLGESEQALALAHIELDAELILQILDVLGHAGLGGVESVGHLGEVEIAPYRFPHDAQLLEVHFASFSSVIFCVARYTLHLIAAMLHFSAGKLVGRSRSELARPPATCNLQPVTQHPKTRSREGSRRTRWPLTRAS